MSWYDRNRRDDRVAIGGQIAFMIGWTWLFFAVGVFVVIFYFWDVSWALHPGIHDGNPNTRDFFILVASLFGVIPAYILTILRTGRDIQKQTEQALQSEAQKAAAIRVQSTSHLSTARRAGFSGVTLGTSTGFLSERGHYSGIKTGSPLHLSPADVCKNIVIFGGIGSGKTTRFINPLLHQVLVQDVSALIFDIKGDFRREVDHISGSVGRSYRVVGDGGMTLNLFRGCTPEVAASYLKSCFIVSGSTSGDGAFWAETATNYCRNILSLIRLAKGDYSIAGLADLVFSEAKRLETLKATREREQSGDMDAKEQRVWNAVLGYFVETVNKWDDKFRGNVQGTCEAVLNPFVSPDLVDAFSVSGEHGEADLCDLLNKPEIFLVNLPRHKFGANGARFAYLLIKLRFMTMMAERRSRSDVNQSRYISFFCDEYQGIVDSVSDTDFWDKSRSSKCFGILSMQGYSSLVQAVGNPKTADAIAQNWRQRAIARTEDGATIEMAQRLLGQVDVHVTSESYSYSHTSGTSYSPHGSTTSSGSSESEGQSTNLQRQNVFDANDFRKLDAQFALFLGNVGDKAADDVLEIQPYYVPEPETTA